MKIALFLIALGFGFKIYQEASSLTKKRMKNLGRAVGVFIMVASMLGTICGVVCFMKCSASGYGPGSGKGWYCPFSQKMTPASKQ